MGGYPNQRHIEIAGQVPINPAVPPVTIVVARTSHKPRITPELLGLVTPHLVPLDVAGYSCGCIRVATPGFQPPFALIRGHGGDRHPAGPAGRQTEHIFPEESRHWCRPWNADGQEIAEILDIAYLQAQAGLRRWYLGN